MRASKRLDWRIGGVAVGDAGREEDREAVAAREVFPTLSLSPVIHPWQMEHFCYMIYVKVNGKGW